MQQESTGIDLEGAISLAQYPDIRAWCTHLGCNEIELAEAIAVVGYSPDLVRVFLADKAIRPSIWLLLLSLPVPDCIDRVSRVRPFVGFATPAPGLTGWC